MTSDNVAAAWKWCSSNTWSCLVAHQGCHEFLEMVFSGFLQVVLHTGARWRARCCEWWGWLSCCSVNVCLLPVSSLWLASPIFFQARRFMFLNLKLRACLVSNISANPSEFFPKHMNMFMCFYLALWQVIERHLLLIYGVESWKNNGENKYHLATGILLSRKILSSSKDMKKTQETENVSFLPLASFPSPRIHTAACSDLAAAVLVPFDHFVFLCTSSPSTLVLTEGLCIPVLQFLLYFCSLRRKVTCHMKKMLNVQLKSIKIMKLGIMAGI